MATSTSARRPPPPASRAVASGLLRAARPRQWAKNVLVFAAPAAAGALLQERALVRTVVAAIAFCILASGTYLVNDVVDREADRHHPKKRFRPIAAGVVPVRVAVVAGVVAIAAGLGMMGALGLAPFGVLLVYLAITLAYSWRLKAEPVLDLACVASGFVLRALVGGTASHVEISRWFLIVAAAGSMFMVAGKRHAEYVEMGEERSITRTSLAGYTLAYLRFVWMMAASVAVGAYSLWAFEEGALKLQPVWAQLSIVPFTLALLRYALDIEQGRGGAPEDVVLGDRTLQALGVLWLVCFGLGVHFGG